MLVAEWNMETALEVREEEGFERGVEIGERRGVEIGERRGVEIGRTEERSTWKGLVAEKDAELASNAAEIERLRAELKARLGN